MLLLPIFLHNIWTIFTTLILSRHSPSPFSPLFFISHPTPSPTDDSSDPRYRKGWFDLVFLAYHIVFFSFVRQTVIYRICYPIAQYFGIRKEGKLTRFGEQGYAIAYFSFLVHGVCGSCHISRHGGTTVNTSGLVRLLSIVLASNLTHPSLDREW